MGIVDNLHKVNNTGIYLASLYKSLESVSPNSTVSLSNVNADIKNVTLI